MSLLDDVSIVVTPNGYKEGELYAVVPVPTEGTELVTNGDFATDSDWTKTSQVTINNGVANILSNDGSFQMLGQNNVVTIGKSYVLTYTIVSANNGSLKLNTFGQINSTVGTHKFYFVATETPLNIARNSGITDISIDNVSVKEYTSADMDVTRATAATRVDEDGLVNYAEIIGDEEVTNGNFATDSDWDKTGTWSIESNYATSNANGLTQYLGQDVGIVNGRTYKITYTVLSNSLNNDRLLMSGTSSFTTTQIPSSIGQNTVYLTASQTPSSGYDVRFANSATNTSGIITLDNVSVKEVTRDNVPRIDYTGGGCPHILAEPQRTNLITYSEDFSQTDWQKIKSSVTSGFSSPDGGNNAYRWQEDTNSGVHSLKEPYSFTSVDYSQSIFIKPNGRSNVLLWVDGASKGTRFDLSSGTIYSETSSVGKITAMNDGWFKISTTVLGTSGTAFNLYSLDNSGNISYTGDGTSGFYVYGAQLEEGSYATSYIPTSGSTVTRNQDLFTRDGIGSLINSEEGVLFVEMAALSDDNTDRVISLSDGTNNHRILLAYTSTTNQIQAFHNDNVSPVNLVFTVSDITDFHKVAFKYKVNDFALWVDGVEVATNNSKGVNTANTLNELKFENASGSGDFYGKVKQLQVYNTALTDEQLLQLTGTSGTDFYESYAEMASALTYTIQ